jgi:hypothetical protein
MSQMRNWSSKVVPLEAHPDHVAHEVALVARRGDAVIAGDPLEGAVGETAYEGDASVVLLDRLDGVAPLLGDERVGVDLLVEEFLGAVLADVDERREGGAAAVDEALGEELAALVEGDRAGPGDALVGDCATGTDVVPDVEDVALLAEGLGCRWGRARDGRRASRRGCPTPPGGARRSDRPGRRPAQGPAARGRGGAEAVGADCVAVVLMGGSLSCGCPHGEGPRNAR